MRKSALFIGIVFFVSLLSFVAGHEAYTLPANEFHAGFDSYTHQPLHALISGQYLIDSIIITICVVLSYMIYILFFSTNRGNRIDQFIKRAERIGPLIIRLSMGTAFLFAAYAGVVYGPELPMAGLPFASILQYVMFAVGIMVLLGFLTEIAAVFGLIVFVLSVGHFGQYMFTYANYFGEMLVLVLFGSRYLSVDHYLFGDDRWFGMGKYKEWEGTIVRVLYGVALVYAGITIKFLHQNIAIQVFHQYHLGHVFHASAGYIAAGAGLSEVAIGLFILFGFCVRWTTFISVIFITLSLIYFQEMLWPHILLYGISINIMINTRDHLSIDSYLMPWVHNNIVTRFYHWMDWDTLPSGGGASA